MMERPIYPFSAIVGQERMKLALLLNAVAPSIGGVLIRGQKGTAKSTAVRALAKLLPEIEVVVGCPFGCPPAGVEEPGGVVRCESCAARLAAGESLPSRRRPVPLVNLPVGATEDRLVGTLDLEHAIQHGERRFEPGMLAAANRGILYVDEVNLLGDHLVDALLDAAALGVNYVEREGISFAHPARFILVGTMNPEEGDLRPQLLDRFALAVEVEGIVAPELRAEVVRRRVAFEADPAGFIARWSQAEAETRARIARARSLLSRVALADELLALIARICADLGVDGLRADIAIYRAALALAAWEGRTQATAEDVRLAAELALPHRARRGPFERPGLDRERLDELLREHAPEASRDGRGDEGEGRPDEPDPSSSDSTGQREQGERSASAPAGPAPAGGSARPGGREGAGQRPDLAPPRARASVPGPEQVFAPAPFHLRPLALPTAPRFRGLGRGRRSPHDPANARAGGQRGHQVGAAIPRGPARDLAFAATLRAAAPHQRRRRQPGQGGPALRVRPPDLREKVREARAGHLVLFVVDASGSMAARQRMAAVKGAVLALLLQAYQRRDRVGLIAFRGEGASLLLPPTASVELAELRLRALPTGGRTPLAHALRLAGLTVERALRASGGRDLPLLVVVSDGRANVGLGGDPLADARAEATRLAERGIPALVVDSETGPVRLGLAGQLAAALRAPYLKLEHLGADQLVGAVRGAADVPGWPRRP